MATLNELVERFRVQMAAAEAAGLHLPNAASLATATNDGEPSVRMVLLKDVDEDGFAFYTSLLSRKSRELASNPRATLLFWWGPQEQQVVVEGTAVQVTDAEADEYFATRPRGSQLAAWASRQSEILDSRERMLTEHERLQSEYEGRDVPRPPFWSGFRLRPERIEFWYGAPDRLHERREYLLEGKNWSERLLYP